MTILLLQTQLVKCFTNEMLPSGYVIYSWAFTAQGVETSMWEGSVLEGAADAQGPLLTEAPTIVKPPNLSYLTFTLKAKENLGNTSALPLVFIINRYTYQPTGL